MSENIRIFALGGMDENGKCLYVIEVNRDIFIIESGLKYPDRTNPGVDAIIPNFDYLKENKDRVKAYIITHGHDDQFGSLPFIYRDVPAPIYASEATIAIIKAYSKRLQLENNYQFISIKPTENIKIAGREFDFFQTVHSIMDSSGFAMATDQGYIVYSGDFIVEYNANKNYKHDLNALARIAEKNILILLSESAGAEKPGYTSPTHRLAPHIANAMQEAKGRVFISLFNQSVYNLEEVLQLCVSLGKKIIFYDNETADYIKTFTDFGGIVIPKNNVSSIDDLLRVRAQDVVVIMMSPGERIYNKIAELATGDNEDKRVVLGAGDTFIVACPSAPAFEVLATDAVDELYRTGVDVLNIKRKQISSMHAQEEDLKMMLSLLKPRFYLPIKGDYRQLIANAKIAVGMGVGLSHNNIFVLDNGMVLSISEGKGRILNAIDNVKCGDILIDGIGVGDVGATVISERQKLSDDGVIVMGVTVSKSLKKVVAGPDVQMRGFIFVKESDNIIKEITNIFVNGVNDYLNNQRGTIEDLRTQLADKCLRYVRRDTGKNPLIIPIVVEID